MADDTDQSQKTEEPTGKRLADARSKGQVVNSTEVKTWFTLLALAITVGIFGPFLARSIASPLERFIAAPHQIHFSLENIEDALVETLMQIGLLLLIPMGLVLVLSISVSLIMTEGPLLTTEKMKPKLEKISVIAGFKRMFSMRSIVEFVKGILKLSIVTVIGIMVIIPHVDTVLSMPDRPASAILQELYWLALLLIISVLSVMAVVAALDFMYQRYEHIKSLRMTKQEVKDEQKQSEGDPHVKGRLRSIRMERARQRIMQAVPQATVIVTNPTHYAVALKYEMDQMTAPLCVAKGVDAIALKIREIANENEIAIVENPPLARALYATVEIDQEIPTEHYQAVAEIIGYVFRLKGKMPS
jgi:flagellar biosynthetic protein FlhB